MKFFMELAKVQVSVCPVLPMINVKNLADISHVMLPRLKHILKEGYYSEMVLALFKVM